MCPITSRPHFGVDRDELTQALHELLEVSLYQDYAPNGLQIEGKSQIRHLCTAVSASLEVIEQAAAQSADALMVHHGYFWKNEPLILTGIKKARIATLLRHDMNLYAYHLPLDGHVHLGNNACMAQCLGVTNVQSFSIERTPHLLWRGELSRAFSFDELSAYLKKIFPRFHASVRAGETKTIQTIAWCSGAAQDYIHHASKLKVDAFISGEISERTYDEARELNVHYFACGHYATESMAIQKLGAWIADQYGCSHQFIATDNPY